MEKAVGEWQCLFGAWSTWGLNSLFCSMDARSSTPPARPAVPVLTFSQHATQPRKPESNQVTAVEKTADTDTQIIQSNPSEDISRESGTKNSADEYASALSNLSPRASSQRLFVQGTYFLTLFCVCYWRTACRVSTLAANSLKLSSLFAFYVFFCHSFCCCCTRALKRKTPLFHLLALHVLITYHLWFSIYFLRYLILLFKLQLLRSCWADTL